VARSGAEAVVSIRDHGLGIAPDRQARIFERFYRAHAGTSHDYGGLGIGLDMSREIVSRHGGRIWFESAPGVGSTFSFALPLAAREAR
jgi:signal transduction histidine kinase